MKRKAKLLLIIITGFLISVVIYFAFINKDTKILLLGDSSLKGNDLINALKENTTNIQLNEDYIFNNITSIEMYELIRRNVDGEKATKIQKLIKDSCVIISIGKDELLMSGNINIYLYYLESVIKEVKRINNNSVILLGIKSEDEKMLDINKWLNDIAIKYNVLFIDVNKVSINEQSKQIKEKIIANK